MIAMLDADRSGKLGFEEFKILWENIRNWKVPCDIKIFPPSDLSNVSRWYLDCTIKTSLAV